MSPLADGTYWSQTPFSPQGPVAGGMHTVFLPLFIVSCIVFFGVSALILYSALHFRRKPDEEEPVQVHGNNRLELAWTLIPFAILIALFINTAVNMPFINNPPQGASTALQVCVQGQQFNWSYFYYNDGKAPGGGSSACPRARSAGEARFTYAPQKGSGVVTASKLMIPAGVPVRLSIVSADVNHSFYIPSLGGQVNAIPGQTNDLWLQVDNPGTYHGACTELCGLNHQGMLIEIDAMSQSDYSKWFNQAKQKAAAPATADLSGRGGV